MNQTENKVKIEGILSEINVREGDYKCDDAISFWRYQSQSKVGCK